MRHFCPWHSLLLVILGLVPQLLPAEDDERYNAFECSDEWELHVHDLELDLPLSAAETRRTQVMTSIYAVGDTTVFGFKPTGLHETYSPPREPSAHYHWAFLPVPPARVTRAVLDSFGVADCDWRSPDGGCILTAGKVAAEGWKTHVGMKISAGDDPGTSVIRCGPLIGAGEFYPNADEPPPSGFDCTGDLRQTRQLAEHGVLSKVRFPTEKIEPGGYRLFGLAPKEMVYKEEGDHGRRLVFTTHLAHRRETVVGAALRYFGVARCDEIRAQKAPPGFKDPHYADICILHPGKTAPNGATTRGTLEIQSDEWSDVYLGGAHTDVRCIQETP
jgi:hypothetical protein